VYELVRSTDIHTKADSTLTTAVQSVFIAALRPTAWAMYRYQAASGTVTENRLTNYIQKYITE
jgi:phage gpG-like protein